MRKWFMLGICCASLLRAESQFGAEWRKEKESLGSCSDFKKFMSCAETLFTDKPFHIAVGSLAPGNGFGAGGAVVDHWTTKNWRNTWSADAVATANGSWRAGGYVTLGWSGQPDILVGSGSDTDATADNSAAEAALQEKPAIRLYSEATSLKQVGYFGIGPDTLDTSKSLFGMREIITGGNVVFPIAFTRRLNLALLGEANSRTVQINQLGIGSPPSVSQPGYAQFGEGVRLRPEIGNLRLNYLGQLQQFNAPGDARFSFQRLTVDLDHQFALYRTTRRLRAIDSNSPNDCTINAAASAEESACPKVQTSSSKSRNLEGSIGFRFILQESLIPAGHAVPFYFQPTLGGSDINGSSALPSYQDYRFRAPNSMLLRATFEHSIWGPIGFMAMVDEGKVAVRRDDLDLSHLRHSYAAGLTLRAGGFPMVKFLFAWGGNEGTHTIFGMNTSLLGGSSRPSLY